MKESMLSREAGELTREYMASYSRYVAQSRAIPSLVDGLKPSQRRSITSADDLHIYHNSKFMKSAKVEGQVIGDYHPHGGIAFSGLVQPFKIRYPLMEGQGNWGCSDDPGSVAASRYTEVRLTKFAEDFYLESRKFSETIPNYDGRLQEVKMYNPPIPGSLLTGAEGMAIGFVTKVPVHTVESVSTSLLRYLEGQDYLSGMYPDTCEPSILISPMKDVKKLYETGEATLRYRAVTHIETPSKGMYSLVVTAFPPGFSKSKLYNSKILEYVDSGMLTLQNESSTEIRYVFSSRSKDVLDDVLALLESSVSYKMHLEHNGVVSLYSLHDLYREFVASRVEYTISKYTRLSDELRRSLDHWRALVELKQNPDLIKSIIGMSDEDAERVVREYLHVSEDLVRRLLSTSIRSLLKNNIDVIIEKIESAEADLIRYKTYIEDPVSKIKLDIKEFMRSYSDDHHCILEESNPFVDNYMIVDGELTITRVPELDSRTRTDCEYYAMWDDHGFVVCTREYIQSHENPLTLLKDGVPKYILGFNDFRGLYAVYDDAHVHIDTWSIKKRSSRIECKESQSKNLLSINYILQS